MSPSTPTLTVRARRGAADYLANVRLFSRNVWLVLLFGMGSGLTFGVFLFTFNFYVLSLGCLLYTSSSSPNNKTACSGCSTAS